MIVKTIKSGNTQIYFDDEHVKKDPAEVEKLLQQAGIRRKAVEESREQSLQRA